MNSFVYFIQIGMCLLCFMLKLCGIYIAVILDRLKMEDDIELPIMKFPLEATNVNTCCEN